MPNKFPEKKGWNVPKQKFKVTNWSEYNESLRQRGNMALFLNPLIEQIEMVTNESCYNDRH